MNIYKRVDDLVNEYTEKMKMPEVFMSPEYLAFIRQKAANIISGTFYHLRQEGFSATQSAEDRILRNLSVNLMHDPQSEITAFAADNGGQGQLIGINTGHELVMSHPAREEQHLAVLGMLYHELGHVLYTDYPTKRSWLRKLESKGWFPQAPGGINTPGGVIVEQLLQDEDLRPLVIDLASGIENRIEDGYIETEVRLMCPGMGRAALSVINMELIDSTPELGADNPSNPDKEELYDILNQVLLYSKFSEIKVLEDYDGPMLDAVYDCIDVIDECRTQRNPEKRVSGTNEILCILGPYIEKAVQNELKRQQQQQQQQQQNPQNGKPGIPGQSGGRSKSGSQSGNSGNGNQNRQPQDGQDGQDGDGGQNGPATPEEKKKAVQNILKALQDIMKNGASNDNANCSSEAVNKPTNQKNARQNSGKSGGGDGAKSNGPGSMDTGSDVDLGAAKQEVDSVTKKVANDKAVTQAEKERTRELNREAARCKMDQYGGMSIGVSVKRAESVSESNIQAYNALYPQIAAVSRSMQRGIKRVLKERREGGKLRNLPFGRRFEVSSVVHNDGKYFSKKKLPSEPPRLGVGLLVDESGSTSGKLIRAAMMASLVIEDFCRELDIPHLIYGYTIGNNVEIISYAEPDDVGNSNRYRITGMMARGGTPTANSMNFMNMQMKKLPADMRLLIVITDGQSGDNAGGIGGERPIARMIKVFKKEKTLVVAAGIGGQRDSVSREFGADNFLDISDIDAMPEQLVNIIKANLFL